MVISQDVEFNGEDLWSWKSQEEDYNFFPFTEKEKEIGENEAIEDMQELMTPPNSLAASSHGNSSPSSSSECPNTTRPRRPRMRSSQYMYEVTRNQNDITIF